ncbi:MAG: class II aldolase/adducin family protein [Jatrophihabitantaceae bacterium]
MAVVDIDEADLRADLVTCSRLLVQEHVLGYSGHLSARLGADRLLIQPRDLSRAALESGDLLVVDLEGNVVHGEGPPPAETAIHTGVYRARPDVRVICHGHPHDSTTFSMVDTPLRPMRHFAFKFPAGLSVHPDPTHIRNREQGDAVAKTLGQAGACLLRSHGTVVVGDTLQNLLMDCVDIEENARTLIDAARLGPLKPLTPGEIDELRASYARGGHRAHKLWEHYVFMARAVGAL